MTADALAWEDTARRAYEALAALGQEIEDCMPGSPAPCGDDFETHALGYFAILSALAAHCIAHTGRQAEYAQKAWAALEKVRANCPEHGTQARAGLN